MKFLSRFRSRPIPKFRGGDRVRYCGSNPEFKGVEFSVDHYTPPYSEDHGGYIYKYTSHRGDIFNLEFVYTQFRESDLEYVVAV